MDEPDPLQTVRVLALLRENVRLGPLHRRLLYVIFGILWFSGAIWLVIEWLKDPALEAARTPLQTVSMKIHGASMLIYLAMLGSVLTHIRRGFALRSNLLFGFCLIGLNITLVLTGWGLYYVGSESLREWNSFIHWSIGASTLLFFIAHILSGRRSSTKFERITGAADNP
jgi:hypothetical protein